MIIPLNNAINASRLDSDALEFIKNSSITDSTQIRALNELCKDLKREGFWDLLLVAFPMIWAGSTASILRDLKSGSLLETFTPTSGSTASPTYSTNGIQYNGGQWHATDFIFTPNPLIDTPPGHISIYSRTNYFTAGITASGGHGYVEFPSANKQSIEFSQTGILASLWQEDYGSINFGVTATSGFFLFSNVDDNSGNFASSVNPYIFYMSRNGQILGTGSTTKNFQNFGSRVVIGSVMDMGEQPYKRSYEEISWFSCGAGFSNGEYGGQIDIEKSEIFNGIIQKFQTSLGRQV
jgi:hypothetical protein